MAYKVIFNVFNGALQYVTDLLGITPNSDGSLTVTGSWPASPNPGDFGYDAVDKRFKCADAMGNGGIRRTVQMNTANSTTVNTTAVETNLSTNFSIPANSLTAGRVKQLVMMGKYGSKAAAAGTIRLKVKMGSTTLLDTGAITMTDNLTNQGWQINAILTCRSTGASGTISPTGWAHFDTGAAAGIRTLTNAGTATIDTTAAQTLQVSVTFGTSDVANTITVENFWVT